MFQGVQVMRALAALMVVCHHFLGTAVDKGWLGSEWASWNVGNAGVDIFFVISGFIIEWTAGGEKVAGRSASDFLARRAIRILPLAWLFTGLATLTYLVRGGGDSLHLDALRWICSMLMLPDLRPTDGQPADAFVVPVMWSLSYEFYFYALFALTLNWSVRRRLWTLAGWFGVCVLAGLLASPANVALRMLTDALPYEFLAGCLLAHVVRIGRRIPNLLAWVLGGLGVLLLLSDPAARPNLRIISWGLPAVLIVGAVVLARHQGLPAGTRPAVIAGDASYAWYLSHVATLSVFQRTVQGVPALSHLSGWLLMLVFVPLSLGVAELMHRLFEQPVRRALQTRWGARMPAVKDRAAGP